MLISAIFFAYNLILQRQQAQLASPVEVAFFLNLVMALVPGIAAPFLAVIPPTNLFLTIGGAALLAFGSLLLLSWAYARAEAQIDRTSVVSGKSVSVRVALGGRRIIKKKK